MQEIIPIQLLVGEILSLYVSSFFKIYLPSSLNKVNQTSLQTIKIVHWMLLDKSCKGNHGWVIPRLVEGLPWTISNRWKCNGGTLSSSFLHILSIQFSQKSLLKVNMHSEYHHLFWFAPLMDLLLVERKEEDVRYVALTSNFQFENISRTRKGQTWLQAGTAS